MAHGNGGSYDCRRMPLLFFGSLVRNCTLRWRTFGGLWRTLELIGKSYQGRKGENCFFLFFCATQILFPPLRTTVLQQRAGLLFLSFFLALIGRSLFIFQTSTISTNTLSIANNCCIYLFLGLIYFPNLSPVVYFDGNFED